MRNTLKIGITLVVVAALAMSGIALAQSSDDTTATTVAVQDRPGFARIVDRLSPLVEAGMINQTQAEAVAEALIGDMPGPGPRGHRFEAIKAVADFFEMTPQELRTALADYDSLAAFAEANGSSADELIGLLVDQVEAHLAEAVANDRLTEDEAAECLATATEHITEMVNGDIPDRPFDGGPGGSGGGPGFGQGPGGGGFGNGPGA